MSADFSVNPSYDFFSTSLDNAKITSNVAKNQLESLNASSKWVITQLKDINTSENSDIINKMISIRETWKSLVESNDEGFRSYDIERLELVEGYESFLNHVKQLVATNDSEIVSTVQYLWGIIYPSNRSLILKEIEEGEAFISQLDIRVTYQEKKEVSKENARNELVKKISEEFDLDEEELKRESLKEVPEKLQQELHSTVSDWPSFFRKVGDAVFNHFAQGVESGYSILSYAKGSLKATVVDAFAQPYQVMKGLDETKPEYVLSFSEVMQTYVWYWVNIETYIPKYERLFTDSNFKFLKINVQKIIKTDETNRNLKKNLNTLLETRNLQRLGATLLKGSMALTLNSDKKNDPKALLEALQKLDTDHKAASLHPKFTAIDFENYKQGVINNLSFAVARLGCERIDQRYQEGKLYLLAKFVKALLSRAFGKENLEVYTKLASWFPNRAKAFYKELQVKRFGLLIACTINLFDVFPKILALFGQAPPESKGRFDDFLKTIHETGMDFLLKNAGLDHFLEAQSEVTLYYLLDLLAGEIDAIIKEPLKEETAEEKHLADELTKNQLLEAIEAFDTSKMSGDFGVLMDRLQPVYNLLTDQESQMKDSMSKTLKEWQKWVKEDENYTHAEDNRNKVIPDNKSFSKEKVPGGFDFD